MKRRKEEVSTDVNDDEIDDKDARRESRHEPAPSPPPAPSGAPTHVALPGVHSYYLRKGGERTQINANELREKRRVEESGREWKRESLGLSEYIGTYYSTGLE